MNKVITLITALFICANSSFAATTVSGQIRTNTTWTKAGSPYNCSGLIEVDTNVTLTIEPGTVIDINNNINVYGHIVFQNNSTDTTIVKSGTTYGPIICILNSNYTDTIVLKRYKFILSGFVVNGRKTTLTIEECNFNKSVVNWRPWDNSGQTFIFQKNKCIESALDMSNYWPRDSAKSVFINDNIFENSSVVKGNISVQNPVQITNNTFRYASINFNATKEIFIGNNTFYKSGIVARSEPLKIISNAFTESPEAIALVGTGNFVEIRDNAIYNNNIGISVAIGYPITNLVLTGNCIYNNTCSFSWGSGNDVTIGANWWGTTDTTKIDTMIIDDKDDFKKGLVTYTPVLTTSNPGCKTYTPPAKTEGILVNSNEIQAYPNPFQNTIEFRSGKSIKAIYLYDMVGKVLYQSNLHSKRISVNTEEYTTGVYLYRIITDDDYTHTGKLMKQ